MPNLEAINEVRDELAAIQAQIDRARAHLHSNRHMLDEAQSRLFEKGLDERQATLDQTKAKLNAHFPKQ